MIIMEDSYSIMMLKINSSILYSKISIKANMELTSDLVMAGSEMMSWRKKLSKLSVLILFPQINKLSSQEGKILSNYMRMSLISSS